MKKINYTNCYCLVITIAFVILSIALMKITSNLSKRIEILEDEVYYGQEKSEVVHDRESLIQLHDLKA